jgi:hypothetical protein
MTRRQAPAYRTAPASLQRLSAQARRLDRLNSKVAEVLTWMRNGSALLLAFGFGAQPVWRLSNGRQVAPEVARLVTTHPKVVGVGDALPIVGEGLSQTWRYIDDETV